jgi:NAD(P)-dependent dehydrogenase (short-subunit alcohol dehydrogenase family)
MISHLFSPRHVAIFAFIALLAMPALASKEYPELNDARIAAIAQMLPAQPAGFGAPCSDRTAWNPCNADVTAIAAENPRLDCEHWIGGTTSRHQTALWLLRDQGGGAGDDAAACRRISEGIACELHLSGTVETPFVEGYLDKYHAHEKEKIRAELNERQPIGWLGKPEEIASLIRYVCSDEAEFMTGSSLPIDSGWTAA